MVLVRQEIGDVLRDFRLQKAMTLRQVASRASVALGYLSEVERGQKEASSEILASVADALDTPISVIMREVGDRSRSSRVSIPARSPTRFPTSSSPSSTRISSPAKTRVRLSEFSIAMSDEFGDAYGRVLVHDLVLADSGRSHRRAGARRRRARAGRLARPLPRDRRAARALVRRRALREPRDTP